MAAGPIQITADEVNCLIYSYFRDSGFNHSAFTLCHEGQLKNSPHFSKYIPRGELVELLSKALLYTEVESHWRGDAMTTNCKNGFSLLERHICSVDHQAIKTTILPVASAGSEPAPMALDGPARSQPNAQSARAQNALSADSPWDVYTQNPAMSTEKSVEVFQPEQHKMTQPPLTDTNPTNGPTSRAKEVSSSHPEVLPYSSSKANNTPEPSVKRKASPTKTDGPSEKRTKLDVDDGHVNSSEGGSRTVAMKDGTETSAMKNKSASASSSSNAESSKKRVGKPRAQGPGDDITDPRAILLFPGHQAEVFVCAWDPKNHGILATGSKDGVVKIWNYPDPPKGLNNFAEAPQKPVVIKIFSQAEQNDLTSLHWNSDGSLLAIGSYDSILRICTPSGAKYFSHTQHQGPIFAVRFSRSGSWLISGSLDGTTCLWNVKDKLLHRQYKCHTDCCLDVEWLSDTVFASAGADERIHVMRVDDADPVKTFIGHVNEVNQIKVNPSGTRLASCSDDMTARVWRIDDITNPGETVPGLLASEHVVVMTGHRHSVSTIGWCPQTASGANELLCTSSFDCTARLWDSVTGECIQVFRDHRRPVYALSFNPDGGLLATGSGDGWIHIYDIKTREKKWSWYAGPDKPGVFEIDWQEHQGINRIALALECRSVAVIDVSKVPALLEHVGQRTSTVKRSS